MLFENSQSASAIDFQGLILDECIAIESEENPIELIGILNNTIHDYLMGGYTTLNMSVTMVLEYIYINKVLPLKVGTENSSYIKTLIDINVLSEIGKMLNITKESEKEMNDPTLFYTPKLTKTLLDLYETQLSPIYEPSITKNNYNDDSIIHGKLYGHYRHHDRTEI